MEKQKIAIIGIGGRTGTMFAFELRSTAEILGVGREKEIQIIKEGKLYIERNGGIELFTLLEITKSLRKYKENKSLTGFKEKVIKDAEFEVNLQPDIIFLTTKNPVSPAIKYYYQKFENREKIPALILSQNGIDAIEKAKEVLKEIFGDKASKIRVVRVALFKTVDQKENNSKVYIKYSLPIQMAIAKVSGPGNIDDIVEIFDKANFEVQEFPENEAKNLEFSKLFLNLIGMAAASRNLPIREGFENPEVAKEEIEALREYIRVVKVSGGKFLNFSVYPVKLLANLIEKLPVNFLLSFRNLLANFISKKREEKPKELEAIEFYNGAVVKLGKKFGIDTSINEKIYKRVIGKIRE